MVHTRNKIEFGDFQTPVELAQDLCRLLSKHGIMPESIVEPTCGTGNFLLAALDEFETLQHVFAGDINPDYIKSVKERLSKSSYGAEICVKEINFFETQWLDILNNLAEPLLIIGNPPWVTNAELGKLDSINLPKKENLQGLSGFDAVSGKSNFDISEWMLLQVLKWMDFRSATMAMLCKTIVARKILLHAWKHNYPLRRSYMYRIDAPKYFGASVDACFFICESSTIDHAQECFVYDDYHQPTIAGVIGFHEGKLLANKDLYIKWKHLESGNGYGWRTGIKHDCAKVMELRKEGNQYHNGLDEMIDIEDKYIYPMLKSSDLVDGEVNQPKRRMLVTQESVGEDTRHIAIDAPKTWSYLESHAQKLNRRASSIYINKPPYSIFGVGQYSFAPWKVAISSLYKKLDFTVVGSFEGKPIVLDDTVNFLPCESKQAAEFLADLLNSEITTEFYESYIFWDMKRPITIEILRRLDLLALAKQHKKEKEFSRYRFEILPNVRLRHLEQKPTPSLF